MNLGLAGEKVAQFHRVPQSLAVRRALPAAWRMIASRTAESVPNRGLSAMRMSNRERMISSLRRVAVQPELRSKKAKKKHGPKPVLSLLTSGG